MINEEKIVYLSVFKDVRCPFCRKVLAKISEDTVGELNFKCSRCKQDVIIRASKKAK